MTDPRELYRPWQVKGMFFSRMLLCGDSANHWLAHALTHCLPIEILEEWKDRFAFLSTANSDAFRVARKLREQRELIFLSERIIPKGPLAEDHPDVRYFVFATLHEVVHVVRQHRPPDEISKEENDAQEAEANEQAYRWYNEYVRRRNTPHLRELTREEITAAQQKNVEAMQAI